MSKHPQYDASDEAYAAVRHFKKLLSEVQLPHEELDDMPDGAWAEAMGSVLSACKRGYELRLSTARAQATAAAAVMLEERLRAVRAHAWLIREARDFQPQGEARYEVLDAVLKLLEVTT